MDGGTLEAPHVDHDVAYDVFTDIWEFRLGVSDIFVVLSSRG